MTHEFQTRRLIIEERATYVAPSQIPQGKSLEDEVLQPMFVNKRDLKPASTILQTAAQRTIYIDVKKAYNKIMNTFKEKLLI